jgi:hypothetical protein
VTDSDLPSLQQDAQRLLGRCILRLQQYERLAKDILANHAIVATPQALAQQRMDQAARVSKNTLGTSVKGLFESFIVADITGPQPADSYELLAHPGAGSTAAVSIKVTLEMPEERYGQTKAEVDELVKIRNDLVHHLSERYDLWSAAGCHAAADHLEAAYLRIDRELHQLHDWARHSNEAVEVLRSELQEGMKSGESFNDAAVDVMAVQDVQDRPRARP